MVRTNRAKYVVRGIECYYCNFGIAFIFNAIIDDRRAYSIIICARHVISMALDRSSRDVSRTNVNARMSQYSV